MNEQAEEVSILAADHVEGGVVVYFSDGTATLFRQDFLCRSRSREGNVTVTESKAESVEQKSNDPGV